MPKMGRIARELFSSIVSFSMEEFLDTCNRYCELLVVVNIVNIINMVNIVNKRYYGLKAC